MSIGGSVSDGVSPNASSSVDKLPKGVFSGANGERWDFREHLLKRYDGSRLCRSDRRRFQRLQTGLTIANNIKKDLRFLSLTTAKGVKRDICKDFDILKKRISRSEGWKFNKYYKLKTLEGPEKQVLHVVFWGRYISQKWLSKVWSEIHGSPVVDIRLIKHRRGSMSGIASYLISNYFKKQPVDRMSCGWGWAWRGVCKSWKHHIEVYGNLRKSATKPFLIRKLIRGEHYNYLHSDERTFERTFNIKNVLSAWSWRLLDPLVTSRQCKLRKDMDYA